MNQKQCFYKKNFNTFIFEIVKNIHKLHFSFKMKKYRADVKTLFR
jgi:hypothetical protein